MKRGAGAAFALTVKRGAGAAFALAALAIAGPARGERVTDPNAINRYDTRFDVGAASPVGSVGGTIAVPWRYAAVEGSLGWGLTGAQLSIMPKAIPLRWHKSALALGVAATLTIPTKPMSSLGDRRSFFQTAELSYQRAVFVDNVFYVGVGITRGQVYPTDVEQTFEPGEVVYWPAVRIGWGVRR